MNVYETLELVKPAVVYGPAYLDMVNEFMQAGEEYGYNNVELAREDFAQFVRELEEEAEGIGLPPGMPAQQTYLLLKDGQTVIGEIRFRPNLVPPYEKYSGHIGYNIRPLQRGKGYATRQLALLLDEARKLQLAGVSLTIDDENPASVRVIEKNGGKLLQLIKDPVQARVLVTDGGELQLVDEVLTGQEWQLYWIELA
ncbi:MAG TPA: GNAT family N-acetyltransferase [Ktedonobacteraceae bacterium]|nr:GNAT family N-acetyltransferase [Ktedonobacteraceae bacterium]